MRETDMSLTSFRATRVRLRAAAVLVAVLVTASTATVGSAAKDPVNVNSATVEQLAALPGIGMSKAQAIVRERSKMPFSEVDDLERVSGIGPRTLAQLREHVVVDSDSAIE